MPWRLPVVPVLALFAVCALAAQQPPPRAADQRPPVSFRAEINFVEIDAIVTGRDGRFVPGLTKEDFQIIEEGRPQPIATFNAVNIPVQRAGERDASSPAAAIEPDVVTNRQPFNGRLFLLLLDDLQTDIARTTYVRAAAREFIERHAADNDLVAVAFTSGRSMAQDFTASRPRLLDAVGRFTGVKLMSATAAKIREAEMQQYVLSTDTPNAPPTPYTRVETHVPDPDGILRALRARTTLGVLERMSEFLGGVRGRRKAVVYFGEGIDAELVDVPVRGESNIQVDTAGLREAMRNAIAAATRANVNVYTIDPRGLSTGLEDAIGLPTMTVSPTAGLSPTRMVDETARSHQWLRSVADETGGISSLNTNDTTAPLARIIEDSSQYYILGYYAPAGRNDGRFRNVDVRVTRPGLTVRARRGYYAPTAAPRSTRAGDGTAASAELREALRNPLPVSDLVFSASTTVFQSKPPDASVALVVEIDPASVAFTHRDGLYATDLELYVSATDPMSKTPVNNTHHLARLRLRPQTFEAVKREGIRITRRLELRPGRYRLQVGLRDETSGAAGSAFHDVDVPDLFKPPIEMSGILLVSAAATRIPTAEPDRALAALLPGAHTTRRHFPVNDTLALYAEVYDNDLSSPHQVRVTTSVRDAKGREVFTTSAAHDSAELAAGPGGARQKTGGFGHRVTLPAAKLGPGHYVATVAAVRLGSSERSVSRQLTFTVR